MIMAFKLVRVDSAEPLKIKLPIGKHVIGRGVFLGVEHITDKRVSRSHAEIEVTNDTVILKSLHQNPCFYIKKNTDETQILKQNNTAILCNGDKFGILPQIYWYEVIHYALDEPIDTIANEANSESTDIVAEENDVGELTDCELSEDNENSQESQSVLAPQESNQIAVPEAPSKSEEVSKHKRKLSSDDKEESNKRVKTEPLDDVKQEPQDARVKDEPTDSVQAGPSNNQGNASNNNSNANQPPSPGKPATPRERCMYGANCYRRNPQHKVDFCHPSDKDWGDGDRGVCPYGHGCRKRDPRHWLHHEHPPGVEPPPNAPQRGMQVVERRGNVFYIYANSVNFYEDHFEVENSDGDSVDYDYEF